MLNTRSEEKNTVFYSFVRIHVIYRVKQAECGIYFLLAASQNTYSARREKTDALYRVGLYKTSVHFNALLRAIAPPTCNAHTIAIALHDCCARHAPPPTLLVYAVHRTMLVMAIVCNGQVSRRVSAFLLTAVFFRRVLFDHTHP